MDTPPDRTANKGQFQSTDVPYVYMNGVTIGCGDHPSTPKRHRWGPWKYRPTYRERMCLNCALTETV